MSEFDEEAVFVLEYARQPVGILWLSSGMWHFKYSDQFRAQDSLKPLVEFPDPGKEYVSERLWPFFAMRIPSLAQPLVREAIRRERLDAKNEVQLLRRFGRSSVSNPFHLEPVRPQ